MNKNTSEGPNDRGHPPVLRRDRANPTNLAHWRKAAPELVTGLPRGAIMEHRPDGTVRLIAAVFRTEGPTAEPDYATLIERAPELLAWLEKAVQMADQILAGGDDVPARTAWAWLVEHAGALVAKIRTAEPGA